MAKRKLEFVGGKSKKFWTIELKGTCHTATYGRIGTAGRTVAKEFDTKEKAKTSYDKLVREKLGKGYVDAKSDAPAAKKAKKRSPSGKSAKTAKKAGAKMLKLTCPACGDQFTPSPEERELYEECKAKRAALVYLHCTECGIEVDLNPQTGGWAALAEETPYRCPVSRCTGDVSYVEDDEPFWGCGECGAIWYDEANLFKEIDAIVARFKYRRKCYKKERRKWVPGDRAKEPAGYCEKVEQEPADRLGEYVRG